MGIDVPVRDPALAASLRAQDAQPQWEYAYRLVGPVVVEPALGYVVTAGGRLVRESLPYFRHIGPPATLPRAAVRHVPALVSLRDTGDANYYHFLDDVLGRLELLDRLGVGLDLPLLISSVLARQPYFADALRRSPRLRARDWIVQGADEPISTEEVVFAKALPHSSRTLAAAADLLRPPTPDPTAERRLLLVRDPARGRHLRQPEAVELCVERGFEPVDTAAMDLDAQIALFAGARLVVAPHGAGLVNLLWRRGAACSLLELFPPESSPAHYHWLTSWLGFGYDALPGTAGSAGEGFDVDLADFAAALDRLTCSSSGTSEPEPRRTRGDVPTGRPIHTPFPPTAPSPLPSRPPSTPAEG